MSILCSPATNKAYGIQRVCRAWETPRSSLYAQRKAADAQPAESTQPRVMRGPKPKISNAVLWALIEQDLANSLFKSEGHRPIWRRLRRQGIKVSKKRVLRLTQEHSRMAPRRSRQGKKHEHTGSITTDKPNLMWGTDGIQFRTQAEGNCWAFFTVDHFNSECMGWYAVKKGDRFAALEPIRQALVNEFGSVGAEIALGLALRMDHGTQYTSEHFQSEIKFFGITASFAYVAEPQTNGISERFGKTLREQVLEGANFRNLEEARAAITVFIRNYNWHWLSEKLEKMGCLAPAEARAYWFDKVAA